MKEINDKQIVYPVLNVETRWNSTYDFIQRAIDIQFGIDRMVEEVLVPGGVLKEEDMLTKEDWKILRVIRDFLQIFKDVTKEIEGYKQDPTVALSVPLYNLLLEDLEDWSTDSRKSTEMQQGAKRALSKIEKYYDKCTDVFLVATALDPRMKLDYFRQRNLFGFGSERDLVTEKVIPA